jgi:hypothetical protein
VNLDTGDIQEHVGSWGGANMFNPGNAVDLNRTTYPLPENGAIVDGHQGGDRPVYAVVTVHPSRLVKVLPAAKDVTARQREILGCFIYKGGEYRKAELARKGVTPAELDELVAAGFISRNRAGAMSLTTDGRNARGNSY